MNAINLFGTGRRISLGSLAVAAILLVPPAALHAQVLYGALTGNVVDASGAAVAGAQVSAKEVGTGVTLRATTNDSGVYAFNNIAQGTYTITVTQAGFGTFVENGIVISNNASRRVDAKLQVTGGEQTVTVQAEGVGLQTDRADINVNITGQQVNDLPTSANRNFQSLVRTVPGATPPAASHSTASNPQQTLAYNVNGASNTTNVVNIDGASDAYPWFPENAAYTPPQEAISGVNIVTNSADPEIGFGAGSAMNVTLKTGTNQFHGAAWEYNTLSNLAARTYYQTPAVLPRKAKNILNSFGANFGGPIFRNKLFFFSDWERYSARTAYNGYYTVPTAALISGDFSGVDPAAGNGSNPTARIYDPNTGTATGMGRTQFAGNRILPGRMSAAAMKMLALLPAPNVNVPAGTIANNYFATSTFGLTRNNYDAKVSYNTGGKLTIFGSYSHSPSTVSDSQALGAAGGPTIDGGVPGNAVGKVQRVSVGGTYTITPHLLFDGNFAFTLLNNKAANSDIGSPFGLQTLGIPGTNSGLSSGDALQNGIPNFQISGFTSLGNSNASSPFQFTNKSYVEDGNFTWLRGAHNIRFGAQIFHFYMTNLQANTQFGVRGGFSFTGGLTALNGGTAPNLYNSLADFELGLPYQLGEDHQVFDPSVLKETEYGFFIRDSWQASPRLTLNYGARYEFLPYANSDQFGGLRYDPTTNQVLLGGKNGAPQNAGVDAGKGLVVPRIGIAYRATEKTVIRAGFALNPNAQIFRSNIQNYPNIQSQQYSGANSFSAAGDLRTGIPAFTPQLLTGTIFLPANYGDATYPAKYRRGYSLNTNLFIERDLGLGFLYNLGYVHTHAYKVDTVLNINAGQPGLGKAGQPLYALYGNSSTINLQTPLLSADYNALQTTLKRQVGRNGSLTASYTYSKAMNSSDMGDEGGLTFSTPSVVYRNYAIAGFDRTHNVQITGSYALPFGRNGKYLTHGFASALAGGWQLNAVLLRTSGTPFSVTASNTSLNAPGNTQLANRVGTGKVAILGGHVAGKPYFDTTAFAPVTTATFGNSSRNMLRGPGYFDLDASLFRDFAFTEKVVFQFRAESFALTNTPNFGAPSSNVSGSNFGIINSASGNRQLRFGGKLSF